uniref:Uncharacterized protein n=1 Tax=Plectus sambesii TaxID=2011161 RepID=A0A914XVK2_9BILA
MRECLLTRPPTPAYLAAGVTCEWERGYCLNDSAQVIRRTSPPPGAAIRLGNSAATLRISAPNGGGGAPLDEAFNFAFALYLYLLLTGRPRRIVARPVTLNYGACHYQQRLV